MCGLYVIDFPTSNAKTAFRFGREAPTRELVPPPRRPSPLASGLEMKSPGAKGLQAGRRDAWIGECSDNKNTSAASPLFHGFSLTQAKATQPESEIMMTLWLVTAVCELPSLLLETHFEHDSHLRNQDKSYRVCHRMQEQTARREYSELWPKNRA